MTRIAGRVLQRPFSTSLHSRTPSDHPKPRLTHLSPSTSSAHMVPVHSKPSTHRVAVAAGFVRFAASETAGLIRSALIKKGDVLAVARVAGIMAAKKTSELIPLCHPIALSSVAVELEVVDPTRDARFGGVKVEAKVQCEGPTGVEMEALTAVMGASATVYDMCKAVDRAMVVEGVRVVRKEGGRSGGWIEEGYAPLVED
jgi:molybdenum cofactor biosynthesis protein MoaC